MPEIGGVAYGEEAYAHMRRLHADLAVETDPGLRATLLNEAEVIHELHVQFPGLKWSDEVQALPDPDKNRIGKFSNPLKSGAPASQREGALAVFPRSGHQRRRLLDAYGESLRGLSDEEMNDLLQIGHRQCSARRHELMDDGWVEDSGRTTPSPTSGVNVHLYVLTPEGRARWESRDA